MDLLKQGAQNVKALGFGSAFPKETDRILGAISGETDEKIKALEAEVAAGRKSKAQAEMEAKAPAMKKGGKVKTASSRADGCCVKGKTKGKMV